MKLLSTLTAGFALLVLAACGAGAPNAFLGPGGPGQPPPGGAITQVLPGTVMPDVQTPFTIVGQGFAASAPAGSAVEVTFTEQGAVQPLVATLGGTIDSDTQVSGSILNTLANRPILHEMQMAVRLSDPQTNWMVESAGALVTFRPHTRVVNVPNTEVRSCLMRKRVLIEGMGLGNLGSQPVVRFRATVGQPFEMLDGTITGVIELPATILSDTELFVETPTLRATAPVTTTIAMGNAGGTLTTNGQTMTFDSEGVAVETSNADELFGIAVDISGETAVVGAPLADRRVGAAYVIEGRGSAAQIVQRLVPAGSPAFDPQFFGLAVAIEGNRIAIGAPGSGPLISSPWGQVSRFDGAVYLFERTGPDAPFEQVDILTNYGQLHGAMLGYSVALSGDRVVAGAPRTKIDTGTNILAQVGSVSLFEPVGGLWTGTARFFEPNKMEDARFGHAVDIDDDRIAVGAPGDEGSGVAAHAYVFARDANGWQPDADLTVPSPSARFGYSIAISRNKLLVGAPGSFFAGAPLTVGEAWLYEKYTANSAWAHLATARAQGAEPGDGFGLDVAMHGDRALIGSREEQSGAATFFEVIGTGTAQAAGLRRIERRTPPSPVPDELFGAVAIDFHEAIVGAPRDPAVPAGLGRVVRY